VQNTTNILHTILRVIFTHNKFTQCKTVCKERIGLLWFHLHLETSHRVKICNPIYPIWSHVTTDKCIHPTKDVMQLENAPHNLQAASKSLFLHPKCALSSKFLALISYRLILTCSCSLQPLNLDWSISVWCWGKTWIWGLWCSNCWARCARMWTCL